MSPLQPLIALLEQTERERDAVQAQWLRQQEAHRNALAQAEQLLAYRRDYEARWSAQFAQEGKIELVRCYQGFVTRLSQAVEHQAQVVSRAATQVELGRVALQEAELRVASVRKLIDGRLREARRDADRRDQKATDEFASRSAWNRMATLPQAGVA